MNKIFNLALAAACLVTTIVVVLRAAAPMSDRGRFLVLESTAVLEGDIHRDGNQYCVRRTVGETVVPADNVVFLCDTLDEAYRFLCRRANLRDADERIRLARWCHLHGLHEQALAEMDAALKLRPGDPVCRRLLESMRKASASAASRASPKTSSASVSVSAPPPTVEITADSLGLFVTRVQPIVMNTCASCHVSGRGGNFKLLRGTEGGTLNRRATQQNVAAVLKYVNLDHWQASPFLTKSISVHGDATQPPIKSRQSPAFRALEDWVRDTVASNAQLQDSPAPSPAASTAAEPASASSSRFWQRAPDSSSSNSKDDPSPSKPKTSSPTAPLDPFDPAPFNHAKDAKSK
jgi:hypothetical protein